MTDSLWGISILGCKSSPQPLCCGVPQGSAPGPKVFTIYTLPLDDIIHKHSANFHLCADDTHLYLTCNRSKCPTDLACTLVKLEACTEDIHKWMPLIPASSLMTQRQNFSVYNPKTLLTLHLPPYTLVMKTYTPGPVQ